MLNRIEKLQKLSETNEFIRIAIKFCKNKNQNDDKRNASKKKLRKLEIYAVVIPLDEIAAVQFTKHGALLSGK